MCHDMPRQLVGISIAKGRENEGMETEREVYKFQATTPLAIYGLIKTSSLL